jgi:hypothetical protein
VFAKILNYGIRFIILIIGVLLVTGVFSTADPEKNSILRIFGVIFIIFGLLRLFMYYNSLKRYRKEDKDE